MLMKQSHSLIQSRQGFSLVELSLVLVILAGVVAGGMMIGLPMVETSKVKQTNDKIKAIEAAMMVFRKNYNRLPCPSNATLAASSTSFGIEYPAGATNCVGARGPFGSMVEGGVPVRSLSLPDDFANDGWGNRMTFAVDRRFTSASILPAIPTNQTCPGQASILDETGATRTANAVSLIVSHGPNGHGAFPGKGGTTRLNASSANTQEQTNCHCNASGGDAGYSNANYVLRNEFANPANALDTFDDIVVYKTRADFATSTDVIDYYDGPELVVGSDTNPRLTAYNMRCGEFVVSTTSPSPQPTAIVVSLAFSWNNQFVATGTTAGTPLTIYQRSADALTGIALAVQPSNNRVYGVSFSPDDNYLAVATQRATAGSEPGMLTVYQRSGLTFTPLPTTSYSSWAPGTGTTPQESVAGYAVDWLYDSSALALARDQGDRMSLYTRRGDYFTQLTNPTTFPTAQTVAIGYSPDGSFMATATAGSAATPQVIVYQRSGTSYTVLHTYTTTTSGSVPYMAWSPNKLYFAYTYGTSGMKLYKINGTTFTDITANITPAPSNPWGIAFSRDSRYLAIADAASASNVKIYSRNGDNFVGLSVANVAGSARSVAFRH